MDAVTDPLHRFRCPPAWLRRGSDGSAIAQALAGTVPELSGAGSSAITCVAEDLRLKGAGWVGRYVTTVRDDHGGEQSVVLDGVLRPDGVTSAHEGTAWRAGFGDPDWNVILSDPPIALRTAGQDRKLRGLPPLLAGDSAREVLEGGMRATYPGIRVEACAALVARYRPGQRCTVICTLRYGRGADPAWPEVVIAKAHRRGEGRHAYGALEALDRADLARAGGPAFALPLAYLEDLDISLQGVLPEDRSLPELITRAAGDPAAIPAATAALNAVGGSLAMLHRSDVAYGPSRTIDDEIGSGRRGAARLAAAVPEVEGALEPLLQLVEKRATEVTADPPAPSHGAFRPAQVRLAGDRVGVLDLDKFGRSEPAEDLGRFVGKLRLLSLVAALERAPQDPLAVGDQLAAAFLDGYAARSSWSAERVGLWECLDLANTLLQSWSRVRLAQIGPLLTLLERRVATLA